MLDGVRVKTVKQLDYIGVSVKELEEGNFSLSYSLGL